MSTHSNPALFENLHAYSFVAAAFLLPLLYFRDCYDVHREYAKFCRELAKESSATDAVGVFRELHRSVHIFRVSGLYFVAMALFFMCIFAGSQIWLPLNNHREFINLDEDHSSTISKAEFSKYSGIFAFTELDQNKDGSLSTVEFGFAGSAQLQSPNSYNADNRHLVEKGRFQLTKQDELLASRVVLIGGLIMQSILVLRIQLLKRLAMTLMTDISEDLLFKRVPHILVDAHYIVT